MKTAAKVFIILGMIFQFYFIFPIIVGAIALSKLNKATAKQDLTGIGVCTIIFCSTLGGIFMLCIPSTEFSGIVEQKPVQETKKEIKEVSEENSAAAELKNLKKLLDDGIIDEETYNEKRQKYVDLL